MTAQTFGYARATNLAEALANGADERVAFLAGGTDLLQLWKSGAAAHDRVIDLSRLPLNEIVFDGGALRIGALARMAEVAAHSLVSERFPLIAEAILASASGQIRNMATIGGNLLQRTRCVYFRGSDIPCNKRQPGSGCGARAGDHRQAALFGASPYCIATHPSDLAVALVALDATVTICSAAGSKTLPLSSLYRLPGDRPYQDTVLLPGEIITEILVPLAKRATIRSTYLKVRDRASFEFAVVSVAATLFIDAGRIVDARLVAGGVAPMPWRLAGAEAVLIGQLPSADLFALAGTRALEGAEALRDNAFKIDLLRASVVRALTTIGA